MANRPASGPHADTEETTGSETTGPGTAGPETTGPDELATWFSGATGAEAAPASAGAPEQPQSRRAAREALDHDRRAGLHAWKHQHYPPQQRRKRSFTVLWVGLAVVVLLGGLGGIAYAIFQPQISQLVASLQPNDYTGDGYGTALVTIKSGQIGSDVADTLEREGVTKTSDAFYSLLLQQHPAPVFQPGTYRLAKKMSAAAALAALQDPKSRVDSTAVIPEGTTEAAALQLVADGTKIPLAELKAAAKDPAAYGVPKEAKTLEGFLFPATYKFPPGTTAHDAIKTMVDRSFQALDDAGVAAADRYHVIVFASLVQREGTPDDFAKVARVFQNRLDKHMLLQSDATVAYGSGHTDRVETTDAERADAGNPYNTYVHYGLPVAPIANPGDQAIDAVLHPATGSWLYFVTWNLKTGDTIFSSTLKEHEAAVAKWQQWMRDNPSYG